MSIRPLVQLLDQKWAGKTKPLPYWEEQACPTGPISGWKTKTVIFGTSKLVQQAIGPAAGLIVGWKNRSEVRGTSLSSRPLVQLFWTIKPLPIWRSKLVQQAIGSAAGPTVGGRIKPLPDGEDQACPAGHWSSCWTQRGLKEKRSYWEEQACPASH